MYKRQVLAADVDPDANLGLALGFPEEVLDSIVPISKMRKLIEERTGAGPGNAMYTLNPKVDDIPDTYSKTYNGVKLLTLGTVETGEMCIRDRILRISACLQRSSHDGRERSRRPVCTQPRRYQP